MAAILNSAILNFAILDSAILVFPLKLTHTCQDLLPLFAQKKTSLFHSDSSWWWQPSWILLSVDSDTAILDSDTLLTSFRFTQTHCHSSLTQTNSIWLKLIQSQLTWWWQPSWNLPSWIQPIWTKKYFTHSFWLNFMMAAILNTAILDSAILHKTLSQTNSFWLNLMMAAILNSSMLECGTAILDLDTLLSSLGFT